VKLRCAADLIVPALAICLAAPACIDESDAGRLAELPERVFWAWERPEDLRGLSGRQAGVADEAKIGLAPLIATLRVHGTRLERRPRLQPLAADPHTPWLAVVRIETRGRGIADEPALDGALRESLVGAIRDEWRAAQQPTEAAPPPLGLQIDFDAALSERWFYRNLLEDLRSMLPEERALTMTALASWIVYEDWTRDLPVDEVCPMYFRMGRDAERVQRRLASARGLAAVIGKPDGSTPEFAAGFASDELEWLAGSPAARILDDRRIYIFSPRPWTPESGRAVLGKLDALN